MTAHDKRIILATIYLFLASMALGRNEPAVRWGHQLVTPTRDTVRAAGVDSNDGIYFCISEKHNNLSGGGSFKDSTLCKYNQQGEPLWQRQLNGFVVEDFAGDDQGNIYAFGYVRAASGHKTKGGHDGFVIKYGPQGKQQWKWHFGTPEHDVCTGLDFDASGNLYVAGYTYGDFAQPNQGGADLFIAAYDQHRTLLWQDQMGTGVDDRAMDIRVDAQQNVYLCGNTAGKLGKQRHGQRDIVVAKYSPMGQSLWLRQYGTAAHDTIMCMEIGELGHLYLGCRTNGKFGVRHAQRQDWDSCLVRISETGALVWKRQFGSLNWDGTWDMARFQDGSGDVLISGCQYPKGVCLAFNRRYSATGKRIWTKVFRQRSPQGGSCGRVCAIDSANNCYHGGITKANEFGTNNGTPNVFIVRFDGNADTKAKP